MKKYILLLALVPFMFISCDKNSDVEEPDIRERFVGDYILSEDGHLDVYIDNVKQSKGIDIDGKNKPFTLKIDNSSKTKMLVSGYLGNLSAEIKGNYLYIDPNEDYVYKDGWGTKVRIIFERAELVNDKLTWTGIQEGASTNLKHTVYAYGEVFFTATKIVKAENKRLELKKL